MFDILSRIGGELRQGCLCSLRCLSINHGPRIWSLAPKGGEAGAFGELFERQVPRLLTFIRLRLSAQLAVRLEPLDVLQETGLGAFQSIGDFEARGRGAFGRWLCAIAENRIRDGADYLGAAKRLPPGRLEAISVVLERACQTVTARRPALRGMTAARSWGGCLKSSNRSCARPS